MLSLTEKLLHCTVRIECLDEKQRPSSGTGFFFAFPSEDGEGTNTPVIVTNKHVVRGQTRGCFYLTTSNGDAPAYGKHRRFEVDNFAANWLEHPDPDVDLAAMLVGPHINHMAQLGAKPFLAPLSRELIPTNELLAEMHAVEDIYMVGYPNGLWDMSNNLPIVRRGITATPPFLHYQGRPEFLIDAACFPGSSGSPVFIVNQGMVIGKNGDVNLGTSRVMLLGVLYAGPTMTSQGEIVVESVPTALKPIPIMKSMMNLGVCVSAQKILDLEPVVKAACGLRKLQVMANQQRKLASGGMVDAA